MSATDQQLRDVVIVLEQLYAIKPQGWDINDSGKEAFQRLDPEWVAQVAEHNSFWSRFKRRCSLCGR